MSTYRLSLLSSFAIVLTGCTTLAPEYVKPSAPVAETWPIAQSGDPDSQPIDELGWSEFYGDERLRQLIELALNNNRSLRQDALAVESARAQFLIARANTIPSVDGSISSSTLRTNGDTSYTNSVSAGISAFELDVFGRLNNLRDSELETYLSFEETDPKNFRDWHGLWIRCRYCSNERGYRPRRHCHFPDAGGARYK